MGTIDTPWTLTRTSEGVKVAPAPGCGCVRRAPAPGALSRPGPDRPTGMSISPAPAQPHGLADEGANGVLVSARCHQLADQRLDPRRQGVVDRPGRGRRSAAGD